jgi:hypothetical protein
VQVDFYCDNYHQDDSIKILDISEPDWCSYLFKVSTKYMCTGIAHLPKASSREGALASSRKQRNEVALQLDKTDGFAPVLKRKVRCRV